MIKFKVRPAATTKILLAFCNDHGVGVPADYNVFKGLTDFDLTSASAPIRLVEYLADELADDTVLNTVIDDLSKRLLASFNGSFLSVYESDYITQINDFYINMVGVRTNLDWRFVEDESSISFIAKPAYGSVFEDMMVYKFLIQLMALPHVDAPEILKIKFSFGREKYHGFNLFEGCEFNNDEFSLTVAKNNNSQVYSAIFLNRKLADYDLFIAGCNTIPINELNITSLAFTLGMSKRNLTRHAESLGISLKTLISNVRYKKARRLLIINNGNIKLTACDCGYTDQGRITKIFTHTMGISPSEFLSQTQSLAAKNSDSN